MSSIDDGVDKLIQLVLRGDWAVGEAIKPERFQQDLGLFGADTSAVKQAAIQLGLLVGRSGAGCVVLPRERWDYRSSQLVRGMIEHNRDVTIRRLSEVREAIEPIAASYAALRSDDDADEINRLAERIDLLGSVSPNEFAHNRDAFGEADVKFHALILRASRNPFFEADTKNVELALECRLRQCAPPGRGHLLGTASYYPEQPAEIAMIMHVGLGRAICQRLPEAAEAMARGIVVEFNPERGTPGLRRRLQAAAETISWGPYDGRVRSELWE